MLLSHSLIRETFFMNSHVTLTGRGLLMSAKYNFSLLYMYVFHIKIYETYMHVFHINKDLRNGTNTTYPHPRPHPCVKAPTGYPGSLGLALWGQP